MSAARSEEIKQDSQELSIKALLDEEFKSVFGGSIPVTVPWAGLIFV
ncbi:hypothetical protein [Arthrobacter sp. M4]|nr:hypothetical protein [Arthrobacter sp. M4]MCA4131715.1 hypothetical protein [Arthrobacter sp. M4]